MAYKFRLVSDEVDNFRREIDIDADATFLTLRNAPCDDLGRAGPPGLRPVRPGPGHHVYAGLLGHAGAPVSAIRILLHSLHYGGDHHDGVQQFTVHADPVLNASQFVQHSGKLIAQCLVDPWIALHHYGFIQQTPGDIVLLCQTGETNAGVQHVCFLR